MLWKVWDKFHRNREYLSPSLDSHFLFKAWTYATGNVKLGSW